MMRRAAMAVISAALCLAASGCAGGRAEVRTNHPPLGHMRWQADRTAYDFSKGHVIEVAIERSWPQADGGAGDYDFVHLTVPDTAGTYQVSRAGARAERLVRIGQEEFLYRAVAGTVSYRFAVLGGDHVNVSFDLTMELIYPKEMAGSRWPLVGSATSPEDITVAQGLVNKYESTMRRLDPPPVPPAPPAPAAAP